MLLSFGKNFLIFVIYYFVLEWLVFYMVFYWDFLSTYVFLLLTFNEFIVYLKKIQSLISIISFKNPLYYSRCSDISCILNFLYPRYLHDFLQSDIYPALRTLEVYLSAILTYVLHSIDFYGKGRKSELYPNKTKLRSNNKTCIWNLCTPFHVLGSLLLMHSQGHIVGIPNLQV